MYIARRKKQPARSMTMGQPVSGWDTRSSQADMILVNPRGAGLLDNFFPETEKVTLRPGSASHATGLGGQVQTLMDYTKTDGTNELYGCANGKIFDVSSSGAVGSAKVSSMTNNKWQHVNFGTSGGQFLLAFNGEDTPRTYNGLAWSTFGATGPTVANLIWCNVNNRRLFFGEKDSLSFWYLAVNAITGTASEFPLHGVFSKGGFIMAMGTWTHDSGSGSNDSAIFITSEGEVAVYSGIDPATAADWLLVGVFTIGRPIGRRCLIKSGADLIIITEDGFVPVSQVLQADRSQAEIVAISNQINDAVNEVVTLYSDLFGWQSIIYNKGQMIIFNIPIIDPAGEENYESHQYVFNTLTGAPCRFKNMGGDGDAVCWGVKGNQIYFGKTDGTVWEFDKDKQYSDGGTAIVGDMNPAFNYFGTPHRTKSFKMVEPVWESVLDPNPTVDMTTNFQIRPPRGITQAATSATPGGLWGSAKWGIGTWGSEGQIYRGWRGVRGKGRSGSVRIRVSTSTVRPSLISTNFVYTIGGYL